MTHDEAISLLTDAPRLVAIGIRRGWIKLPSDEPQVDGRKHNGTAGFQEAAPDSDPEMVEFRRTRNLSQSQAAHLCGVTTGMWHATERKQRKPFFQLPV